MSKYGKWTRGALCASTGLVLGTVAAYAQEPAEQEQAPVQQGAATEQETGEDVQVLDTIIVNGYRESLAEALDIERDYVGVVDAIVAEDIGQFPQSNLSEAVQRISGVQIRRDFAGGVGNEISIRGLPPEYSQVTIDGQPAPTSAEDRTFNFNDMPAEIFRAVKVYKSPTAAQDEGGLGGVVALETIRPMDFNDRRAVISLEGVYNDITEELTPRVNGVFGHQWGDNVAIVLGGAYSEFSAASQSYDSVRWTRRDFDVDGDGTNDYEDVFLMDLPRLIHQQQDVERLALTGALEFDLSPEMNLLLDAMYIDNSQLENRLTPIWFFRSGSGIQDIVVSDGAVEAISFDEVVLKSENNTAQRDTTTQKFGITFQYDVAGWETETRLSRSTSERDSEDFRYYADNTAPASYDIRQDNNYFTIDTPTDLADPDEYVVSEARHYLVLTEDTQTTLKFDASRFFGDFFTLDTGLQYRQRNKTRERYYTRIRNINEPFAPIAAIYSDFLSGEDDATGVQSSFAYSDFGKAFDLYGSQLDLSNAGEPNNAYDVTEDVIAGYVMGTWENGPLFANAGVRLMSTEVSSDGVSRDAATGLYSDITSEGDYFDALPSASIRYEAMPDLYLRAAAARVLTRPSLGDLAAYRTVDDVNKTISAKNPDLDPFRANQFDLAVDWHFAEDAVLSVGYFYKDVESFIGTESSQIQFNGETYTLTQPVNRNEAVIDGFEVNYQQPFTMLPAPWDGFGVVANYTYTDSSYEESLGDGGTITYGLPENSEDSYNLVLYYENDTVSARLAHNYRSEFLREVPNEQDGLKYRDGVAQTDFSARYNLTPKLQLTFDVLNLLNDHTEEYVYDERLTDGYFTTGRTFQFGARATF